MILLRKVRAAQSAILPNGKACSYNTTESATENNRLFGGKGENVG